MQCSEIQERFLELLYQETEAPAVDPELRVHIDSCPACRKQLSDLRDLQETLKAWEDEPPLRPVRIPGASRRPFWSALWSPLRYAAIAALVALGFLGLANANITWDSNGFSFRTHLISRAPLPSDYYTKEEMQAILEWMRADSQEANFQMMNRWLDTIDQERATDIHFLTSQIREIRNKN